MTLNSWVPEGPEEWLLGCMAELAQADARIVPQQHRLITALHQELLGSTSAELPKIQFTLDRIRDRRISPSAWVRLGKGLRTANGAVGSAISGLLLWASAYVARADGPFSEREMTLLSELARDLDQRIALQQLLARWSRLPDCLEMGEGWAPLVALELVRDQAHPEVQDQFEALSRSYLTKERGAWAAFATKRHKQIQAAHQTLSRRSEPARSEPSPDLVVQRIEQLLHSGRDYTPTRLLAEYKKLHTDGVTERQIHEHLVRNPRFARTVSGRFGLRADQAPVVEAQTWSPSGPTEWLLACLVESASADGALDLQEEAAVLDFFSILLDFTENELASIKRTLQAVRLKSVSFVAWQAFRSEFPPFLLGPLALFGAILIATTGRDAHPAEEQALKRLAEKLSLASALDDLLKQACTARPEPEYLALETFVDLDQKSLKLRLTALSLVYESGHFEPVGLEFAGLALRRTRVIRKAFDRIEETLCPSLDDKDELTVAEASKAFGVPAPRIYNAINNNELPLIRNRTVKTIPRLDLEDWVAQLDRPAREASEPDELVTLREAADLCDLPLSAVQKAMRLGELQVRGTRGNPGGVPSRLVLASEVKSWFKARPSPDSITKVASQPLKMATERTDLKQRILDIVRALWESSALATSELVLGTVLLPEPGEAIRDALKQLLNSRLISRAENGFVPSSRAQPESASNNAEEESISIQEASITFQVPVASLYMAFCNELVSGPDGSVLPRKMVAEWANRAQDNRSAAFSKLEETPAVPTERAGAAGVSGEVPLLDEDSLTVASVSTAFGILKHRIYQAINNNELASTLVDGVKRIARRDAEEWVARLAQPDSPLPVATAQAAIAKIEHRSPDLLTVNEAEELFGITKSRLYQAHRKGFLQVAGYRTLPDGQEIRLHSRAEIAAFIAGEQKSDPKQAQAVGREVGRPGRSSLRKASRSVTPCEVLSLEKAAQELQLPKEQLERAVRLGQLKLRQNALDRKEVETWAKSKPTARKAGNELELLQNRIIDLIRHNWASGELPTTAYSLDTALHPARVAEIRTALLRLEDSGQIRNDKDGYVPGTSRRGPAAEAPQGRFSGSRETIEKTDSPRGATRADSGAFSAFQLKLRVAISGEWTKSRTGPTLRRLEAIFIEARHMVRPALEDLINRGLIVSSKGGYLPATAIQQVPPVVAVPVPVTPTEVKHDPVITSGKTLLAHLTPGEGSTWQAFTVLLSASTLKPPFSVAELRLADEDVEWLRGWSRALSWKSVRRWLNSQTRIAGTWTEREALAYLLVVFLAEAARRGAKEGSVWPYLESLFEKRTAGELFLGGQPLLATKRAIEDAARKANLRNVIGRAGSQQWYLTLFLQFGFTKSALGRLPRWLSQPGSPTEAVDVLCLGPLKSSTFASFWQHLRSYRQGNHNESLLRRSMQDCPFILPEWHAEIIRLARAEVAPSEGRLETASAGSFLSVPKLVGSLEAPLIRVQILPAEVDLTSPGYDVEINGEVAGRVFRNRDLSYTADPATLEIPLDSPNVTAALIGDDGDDRHHDVVSLYSSQNPITFFEAEGLRVDHTRNAPQPHKSYRVIAWRDVTTDPPSTRVRDLKGAQVRLVELPAGWNPAVRFYRGSTLLWTGSPHRGPAKSSPTAVRVVCQQSRPARIGTDVQLTILGLPQGASILWARTAGQELIFNQNEATLAITPETACTTLTVQCGAIINGTPQRIEQTCKLPTLAASRLADGHWAACEELRQLSCREARENIFRLVHPAGKPTDQPWALVEGEVFSTRPKPQPAPLGELAGYGAPLIYRPGPYNSPQDGLLICKEVVNHGRVGISHLELQGRSFTMKLRRPLDGSEEHQLVWWHPGIERSHRVTAVDSLSLHHGDAWTGVAPPGISPEHPLIVALAWRGSWLGSWWSDSPMVFALEHNVRLVAGLVKWLHLPLLGPRFRARVKDFARAHPLPCLEGWVLDRSLTVDDQVLVFEAESPEWISAVRVLLEGWTTDDALQARCFLTSLERPGELDARGVLELLIGVSPFLAARVLRATGQGAGYYRDARAQLLGVDVKATNWVIADKMSELALAASLEMGTDETGTFVRRLCERAVRSFSGMETLRSFDRLNLGLACSIAPFRRLLAIHLVDAIVEGAARK